MDNGLTLDAVSARDSHPSLYHRDAVDRHGLPLKHYFIWSDDIEFTARILRREDAGYLVPGSVVPAVDRSYALDDAAEAMRRLVPDRLRRRWTDTKIAAKRYSCSTFMLYLGLDTKLPGLAHHTICLSGDYERNIREITQGILSEEPSV